MRYFFVICATNYLRAFEAKFPSLPNSKFLPRLNADHLHACVRDQLARRPLCVEGVEAGEGDERGHLGHPVDLPEPHVRSLLLEQSKQGLAHRGGAAEDGGDGGEVVGGDRWVGGEETYEGRYKVEELGPVGVQGGEVGGWVETGQDHHLAAVPEHVAHGAVEGGDVEHGEDHHGSALVFHQLDAGVVHLGHVGHHVPVGEHHPLGHPSCA